MSSVSQEYDPLNVSLRSLVAGARLAYITRIPCSTDNKSINQTLSIPRRHWMSPEDSKELRGASAHEYSNIHVWTIT